MAFWFTPIYGQPDGVKQTLQQDWTLECIALANQDTKERWQVVEIGCPIVILPWTANLDDMSKCLTRSHCGSSIIPGSSIRRTWPS